MSRLSHRALVFKLAETGFDRRAAPRPLLRPSRRQDASRLGRRGDPLWQCLAFGEDLLSTDSDATLRRPRDLGRKRVGDRGLRVDLMDELEFERVDLVVAGGELGVDLVAAAGGELAAGDRGSARRPGGVAGGSVERVDFECGAGGQLGGGDRGRYHLAAVCASIGAARDRGPVRVDLVDELEHSGGVEQRLTGWWWPAGLGGGIADRVSLDEIELGGAWAVRVDRVDELELCGRCDWVNPVVAGGGSSPRLAASWTAATLGHEHRMGRAVGLTTQFIATACLLFLVRVRLLGDASIGGTPFGSN